MGEDSAILREIDAQRGRRVAFRATPGATPCDTGRLMADSLIALTLQARRVLHLNQRTLGEFLGLSRRTIQRWDDGRSHLSTQQLVRLIAAVYPRDASLAAQLASYTGSTLEQLGITKPSPPLPPPPPAAPPAPPRPPRHLTDTVVCAAAEALNVPPPAVRPWLLAAFRRAREAGLRVEDVEAALAEALEPAVAPPAEKAVGKRGRSGTERA
jgi:hypothetical protein